MASSTNSHAQAHMGDGDQKNYNAPIHERRYEEGQKNSHVDLDSQDNRSLANKLAAQSQKDDLEKKEAKQPAEPPTKPAKWHGNEPSKGAKVDEELMADDEAMLKKKGIK